MTRRLGRRPERRARIDRIGPRDTGEQGHSGVARRRDRAARHGMAHPIPSGVDPHPGDSQRDCHDMAGLLPRAIGRPARSRCGTGVHSWCTATPSPSRSSRMHPTITRTSAPSWRRSDRSHLLRDNYRYQRNQPVVLAAGPRSRAPSVTPARRRGAECHFVVPAIRGETIRFAGQDFRADGDRTDGWDGGADDALALLATAASLNARVDPVRTCVYGRSRGGGVALLVAEREPRIRCVVAISPPVDWFDAMWSNNWPKLTLLRVALRTHAGPFDPGGQFIEWVLAPVANGERTLARARERMIAMSPLYYADRLPPLLAFFGAEDLSVPPRNAVVLDSALDRIRPSRGDRSILFAPMAGHDTDPAQVVRLAPAFLGRYLGIPIGERWPGADAR